MVSFVLCSVLTLATLLLLIRVIVSWIAVFGARTPVTGPLRTGYDLLFTLTEPMLRPIRMIVPPAGMFDLSVLVAFVIIVVLQRAFC